MAEININVEPSPAMEESQAPDKSDEPMTKKGLQVYKSCRLVKPKCNNREIILLSFQSLNSL